MNIKSLALVACVAAAAFPVDAAQGVRKVAGCRADWDGAWLKVGNALFSREYVVSNGVLRTVSFKAEDGKDWQRKSQQRPIHCRLQRLAMVQPLIAVQRFAARQARLL